VRIKPEQILVLWPSILKDAEKAGLYIRPGNKKGKLALAQAVGRLIRRVPKGTQGYKRIITQERRNYFAKTFNSLRIRMPGHLAGLVKALVSSIQSGPHTVTGIEHILEKKWKKCSRSNCQTKANKGGLCVKHGSRGICRAEGCTLKARNTFARPKGASDADRPQLARQATASAAAAAVQWLRQAMVNRCRYCIRHPHSHHLPCPQHLLHPPLSPRLHHNNNNQNVM